jgi:hypothetical protein
MTIEYFRLDNLQWINNRFNLSTEKKIFRSSKNKNCRGEIVVVSGSWHCILAKNSKNF